MKELLSPKQVASSIGVSESSLKRWCDQGVITTERTPGGHRRIRIGEVMRFLREQQQTLVRPEVLGLPVGVGQGALSLSRSHDALMEALEEGDGERCRRLVLDLYVSGSSVLRLCEELLTPCLHQLGEGWQCGRVEVYQEHRACEVLNRTLYDLRSVLNIPAPDAPIAIGGTPPGDNYRLATLMVELVLVGEGWNAISLGSSLPFATMAAAARYHEPKLFWLSCSHLEENASLEQEFSDFLEQSPAEMRVVLGGQNVASALRDRVDGERVHFCPDLRSLHKLLAD